MDLMPTLNFFLGRGMKEQRGPALPMVLEELPKMSNFLVFNEYNV